jgi:4,5-dihydroxyphthalate decarboxylase
MLNLSLAIERYDHVRDLMDGSVRADGIVFTVLNQPVEETFFRFIKYQEFDVSEMSFGKYVSMVASGDCPFVGLPVFPSRMFRHSSIYVRADSGLTDAGGLKGKRIGIPEWAQTASIYSRGFLASQHGVALTDVEWVQAGVMQAGRKEKVALHLPPGVRYRAEPGKSLRDMLLAGDIDAVMSARPPAVDAPGAPDPRIVRMYPAYEPVEQAYFNSTGIFPIMHLVALKREVVRQHPWVAMNLYKAFAAAKDNSLARMRDITAAHVPLPWAQVLAERAVAMLGEDFWPYGLEPNRTTLEAFTRFAHEQGVTARKVAVEELFPENVLASVRV